jgi:two-component system, OmpR family, response regulator VicR
MEENNIRVLYIEDDPEMIELVSIILSRHNMKIISADGGRQGLELARQQKPDLILLDLMMPDMDGWDVYHQIKSNDSTQNIPIIVITAKAQAIDRVLGLHIAKVDDYICKPFRPQELLESIDNVLKRN